MSTGCHGTLGSVQQVLTNLSIMNAWSPCPACCTVVWVVAADVDRPI